MAITQNINSLVMLMNSQLKAAAATVQGLSYVDIDPRFEGHRFCDTRTPYFFQTSSSVAGSAMFHSSTEGYTSMMRDFAHAAR